MNHIDLIKKHEGWRSRMYSDSEGVPTIGYGFNLETFELPKDIGEDLLKRKVQAHIRELQSFEWFSGLNEPRRSAIIDMHYNLGHDRFCGFKKMLKALGRRDHESAAEEMLDSKWAGQVGPRAEQLAWIMRNGKYPDSL